MNRRRFLSICAAAALVPDLGARGPAPRAEWRGLAMGSEARITLMGLDPARAQPVFARITREISRLEGLFSLHRDSALTRLNRDGRLAGPSPDLLAILRIADRAHALTAGAFDPTIQPLWRALAEGRDPAPARDLTGWQGVRFDRTEVRMARPGMALSLNGIAQGYLADKVAIVLRGAGLTDVLVDMGEIAACGAGPGGGPWRAAITDTTGRVRGRARLADTALATSAPRGTLIGPDGQQPHILSPDGTVPRWSLIAVAAPQAALADALSTGFCLMERPAIAQALAACPGASLAHIS